MAELTFAEVDALLKYDPETGKLSWKVRTPDMFNNENNAAERGCAAWNARYAGAEALAGKREDGYLQGDIFSRKRKAHHIAWLLYHRKWPEGHMDHINGIKHDNRICNLRDVTRSINMLNQKRNVRNKSGHIGVHWNGRDKRWIASVKINQKVVYIGHFALKDDAVRARIEAGPALGCGPNHGRV